jgi:hypothetical protein
MTRSVLLLGLMVGACGPKPDPVTGVLPSDAVVTIKTNVADADLVLDGHFIGRVGMLRGGVAVVAGKHRLELRHDDYFSSYLEVDLAKSEKRKVAMDLSPRLP